MKWLKLLFNRYLIIFGLVVAGGFLLFGQPFLPSPCFQDHSVTADVKSIESVNKWAERVLPRYFLMFEEEPLWDFKKPLDEGYRLIYNRAFRPSQFVFIWKAGNEHFLSMKQAKQVPQREGDEIALSYKLENVRQLALSLSDWQEFKRLTEVTCYWGTNQDGWVLGKDGESFMLEGLRKGRYHLVHRWMPMKISYYRRLCEYLLKMAASYS